MPTYEEQQKLLRVQVPKGTAGAAELESQGFTDVGQPIDVSQPSPKTAEIQPPSQEGLFKVPTEGIGPSGEQIFDIFKGGQKLEEPEFAKMGVNVADIPVGQAPAGFISKFARGFQQANQELKGQVPGSATQANEVVERFAPPNQQTNPIISNFYAQDSFMQNLVKSYQDFVNPVNQRVSLKESYQQMIKESGIQDLDLEILNTKRIIEETEDSIRQEIQGAGGMANENQILALSASRSKQLIKNFNALLETRNAKEKYLNTVLQLEFQDRQLADQKFEQSFNMAFQIADYGMKMQRNAIESLDRTRQAIGWTGILLATNGDSSEISLIERAYGLPSNGLQLAAQEEIRIKTQAEQERQLGLEEKRAGLALKKEELAMKPLERGLKAEQIKTEQAQRAKIYADIAEKGKVTEKVKQRRQNIVTQADTVISKVDEALKQAGGYTTGLIGRIFASTPGTTAYNLNKTIDTIKSNVGFQALQAMREASPTGGALGQVAVQELTMLQATIASLDIGQSETQLKKNLNEVKQRFDNMKAIVIAEDEGKEVTYDDKGNVIILEN